MTYTLTKVQHGGCTYFAIYSEDTMQYFAGYDFMGGATWEKSLDDCSWLLEDEAYQIKSDLEAADKPDEKGFMATGYTEDQLIVLGLISMKMQMVRSRNESTDSESWDHYDGLVKAYTKMIAEREHVLHE